MYVHTYIHKDNWEAHRYRHVKSVMMGFGTNSFARFCVSIYRDFLPLNGVPCDPQHLRHL